MQHNPIDVQERFEDLKEVIGPDDNIVMWSAPFDPALLEESFVQQSDPKPRGVWYACGVAWIDWAVGENYGVGSYVYRLEIDKSDFLLLSTVEDLRAFTRKYEVHEARVGLSGWAMDWERVAREYSGIEICPYQWSERMGPLRWYYGWDVASGATWVPGDTIISVEEIEL